MIVVSREELIKKKGNVLINKIDFSIDSFINKELIIDLLVELLLKKCVIKND